MRTVPGVTLRNSRRPSPSPATNHSPLATASNRNRQELEMPVTPFLPSKIAFLIATAFERGAHAANPFQLPAPSLQLPNSNNAQKELKIDVSPTESITSNFLIAVAAQGKTHESVSAKGNRPSAPALTVPQPSPSRGRFDRAAVSGLAPIAALFRRGLCCPS